jgi:conjugative transfer signal peptidase TraF
MSGCDRLAGGPRQPARLRHLPAAAAWPLAATVIAISLAGLLARPAPRLVWNISASAPLGFYRISPAVRPRTGDMVAAWLPEQARSLAAQRYYLPANVPIMKRVAAMAGDRVCAFGDEVSINGRLVARRASHDPSGRPLPSWSGCHRLAGNELFLLMSSSSSFDGRYFGMTATDHVIGKASFLWGP